MKRVALIVPPDVNTIDPFRSSSKRQTPMGVGFPIGLGYVASALLRAGYQVDLIDSPMRRIDNAEVVSILVDTKPDYIGLTSFTCNIKVAVALSVLIKQKIPRIPIIIGGPHASTDWENLISRYTEFDYIVRGEAEETAVHLLRALDNEDTEGLSKIPGLVYHGKNGQIIVTGPSKLISGLDSLEHPARHLVDFDSYVHRESIMPYEAAVVSSRGCTNRCVFCASATKWRGRSPENVIDEIMGIAEIYHRVRSISFMDDDFSADRYRVMEICRLFISENLNWLAWSCSCRADQMDEEMLSAMRKAGCRKILFGLESADPEILRRLRKGMEPESVMCAAKMARRVGIPVIAFAILGSPGETAETMRRTRDFLTSLPCEAFSLGIMQVYGGTALAQSCPCEDRVAYIYRPEIENPCAVLSANVPVYEQTGFDRETLKREYGKMCRELVLHKSIRHPMYAMRKLWKMPRTTLKFTAWLLGLSNETQ